MVRRGIRCWAVTCVLAGLAWAGAEQLRAEEPGYKGRSLTEWLSDLRNPSPQVREKAVPAFRSLGPPAIQALQGLLKDADPGVRQAALRALSVIIPVQKEVVLVVVEALHGHDPAAQQAAAATWAGLKAKVGRDVILAFAGDLKHDNVDVRRKAAEALGELHPVEKDVLQALAAALKEQKEGVRQQAADAIGAIGSEANEEGHAWWHAPRGGCTRRRQ